MMPVVMPVVMPVAMSLVIDCYPFRIGFQWIRTIICKAVVEITVLASERRLDVKLFASEGAP
jgi:hypothetical protein